MANFLSDNRSGDSALWRWPPVHPDGRKFLVIAGVATLVLALLSLEILTGLMVGVTLWVAAFFRDPIRVTPSDSNLIIAPADGLVTHIVQTMPPPEITGSNGLSDTLSIRVSIFMSVFDVHINRAPVAGVIRKLVYIPGKFLNAKLDKASEDNERQHYVVERSDGVRVGFTQIAGLLARRIVSLVPLGAEVEKGERVGLIRFGSRVDIFLPADTLPMVLRGQRTIAGETIIARIGDATERLGIGQ